MTHDEFNALLDEPAIVTAIREAELRSTGEVRVLITHRAVPKPLVEARRRFESMGMEKTAQRNGVLIFIAPKTRTFAIVGDTGIHAQGGDGLWTAVAGEMGASFRAGEWTEGLVRAIGRVGDVLARHFPRSGEDLNELPDAILRDPVDRPHSGE